VTAIVLAGGMGTRLKSVVQDVPKPMALIGNKPFLEYLFEYLNNNNVTDVILSVGYNCGVITDYFSSTFRGVSIRYVVENEPLGTGGAIKLALNECSGENIFILNGDTFFDVDLHALMHYHISNSADITISMKEMHDISRYGTLKMNNGLITSFIEKDNVADGSYGYINGGVYCIRNELFISFDLPCKFSFEKFLEDYVRKLKLFGFSSQGNFIDIGIPDDYSAAQGLLPKWVSV